MPPLWEGRQPRRLRWHLALALCTCLHAASAQTLYKCVAPTGQASVQSDPCPPGQTTEWRREYVPDRTPGPAPRAASSSPRPPRARPQAPPRATPSARSRRKSACRSAREHEEGQRRSNATLDYEQLTALRDRTRQACRGL